jgi:hypothetical protein
MTKANDPPPVHDIAPNISAQPGLCPACSYGLSAIADDAGATCPECGRSFTRDELDRVWRGEVPGAAPRSLPPREPRVGGRRMVAVIFILMLLFVALSLGSCWWAQRIKAKRAILISDTPTLTEPMR